MSPDPSGSRQLSSSCSRVHRNLFPNDKAIRDEFADCLAGVCVGNFVDFIGIKPDFALAASNNGCSKSLLSSKVNPAERQVSPWGDQLQESNRL